MSSGEDSVTRALRRFAEAGPREAPPAVEIRLVEAFRREQRLRRVRRRISVALAVTGVFAACLFIGVRLPAPAKLEPPAVIAWTHEPPASAWVAGAARAPKDKQRAHAGRVVAPVHKPTYKPPTDYSAVAPFIALPYGDASLVNDGATVMRVELPGSALRAAGFAVAQDRAGDRVQADLLVGADGLPHAVRLLGFQE